MDTYVVKYLELRKSLLSALCAPGALEPIPHSLSGAVCSPLFQLDDEENYKTEIVFELMDCLFHSSSNNEGPLNHSQGLLEMHCHAAIWGFTVHEIHE